ncbi:hypothetical protein GUJ93_ZPchr0272g29200 [Zizania palustris]|uniref:Uncharacterized protein n=1 Tax=Zizania palustris TaxID=103762 RepID=A0A8J5RBT8_ZIZPA|nr:hypothetical protein GUJ93_ZPchr0272g29200 [Zizania palustris]
MEEYATNLCKADNLAPRWAGGGSSRAPASSCSTTKRAALAEERRGVSCGTKRLGHRTGTEGVRRNARDRRWSGAAPRPASGISIAQPEAAGAAAAPASAGTSAVLIDRWRRCMHGSG